MLILIRNFAKKITMSFSIDIQSTSNPSILKFETNKFLSRHDSFEFHNIETLNTEYEGIQYIIESQSKDEKTLSSADLGLIIRELRDSKLPNPRKIPNVGSFFKNPITNEKNISYKNFSRDDLIIWDYDESSIKVGAGRLIELIKGNLKDKTIENLHLNHALVLTNKNNISYEDILDISSDIKDKVFDEFNIHLEIEPTVIQK